MKFFRSSLGLTILGSDTVSLGQLLIYLMDVMAEMCCRYISGRFLIFKWSI